MDHLNAVRELGGELSSLVVSIVTELNKIGDDRSIDEDSIDAICTLYMALVDLKTDLTEVRGRVQETIEDFKSKRILDKLDAMGVDKVAVPTLRRSFYPKLHHSASMPDRKAGMEWLRENGGASLITETVHHQTLTSFVREMIEEQGMEPPPEIVRFKSHRSLGSSVYTPK